MKDSMLMHLHTAPIGLGGLKENKRHEVRKKMGDMIGWEESEGLEEGNGGWVGPEYGV